MKKIVYDKLVRDKIPDIIQAAGKTPTFRVASKEEKLDYTFKKVLEELEEVKASKSIEEIADLQEVVDAIIEQLGFTKEEVKAVQEKKNVKRGAFKEGYILTSVLETDD